MSAPPPVFTDRVQLGYAGGETTWDWASKGHRGLAYRWVDANGVDRPGGLWLDSEGTERGAVPFSSVQKSAGSTSHTVDISAIQGDLRITGIAPGTATGIWTVTIDGVPVTAWYIANGTSQNFQLGTGVSGNDLPNVAIIVKNPNRGTTLVLQWTTALPALRTIVINHAIGPLINDHPIVTTGGSAPNLFSYEPTSEADWNAFWTNIGVDVFANGATFGVDATTGLKYIRVKIPTGVRNGLSAWKRFNPPLTSVYTSCVFYLENSVWDGIHPDDACKTAFAPTQECPWYANDTWDWSFRGHHGGKSQANPYIFSFEDYCEVQTSATAISHLDRNVAIRCGRFIWLKCFVQMNDMVPGVSSSANGILRYWLNGNLVFESTTVKWRDEFQAAGNTLEATIEAAEVNFYHGGNDFFPVGDMWYRIGRFEASTADIRCPPELTTPAGATFPAWRAAWATDDPAEIAGTDPTTIVPNNAGSLHWNGWAMFPDGRVGAAALGGHNSTFSSPGGGDAQNGQNKVCGIDCRDDAPAWTVKHPGTSAANTPDWSPAVNVGGEMRGPIDDWHYDTKAGALRKHYEADGTDAPIRCSYQSYSSQRGILGAFCNDGNDRIILAGLRSPRSRLGGFHSTRQVDGFRWNDNTWDTPPNDFTPATPFTGSGTQWGDIPPKGAGYNETAEWVTCDDPRTGKIYHANAKGIYIMSPSDSTFHWFTAAAGGTGILYTFTGAWNGWGDFAIEVDPVRNRLFSIRQFGSDLNAVRIEFFPLGGGAVDTSIVVTNGSGGYGISMGARAKIINNDNGLTYDADNDRYILLLSSSSSQDHWYSIHPDTGVATLLWTSAVGAGSPGRVMSSFRHIPALGGILQGRSATLPLMFKRTRVNP